MLMVLRQRNYALLWTAVLVSAIGNFVLLAALPYYVYVVSGSVLATGATFASEMVPEILFGTIGGVLADRWRRKPVIAGSDWVRALVLLPLLAVHSSSTLWIVYATAFLGSVAANFAGPFGNAAVPHVVTHSDLAAANAAFSVATNVAVFVGFPLGGIMLQHVGLRGVVVVDVLSFVLSGVLIASVNVPLEDTRASVVRGIGTARHGARREWLRGLAFVRQQRWLSLIFIVIALVYFGNSIVVVVFAPFVEHTLGGSAQFFSWVKTAQGAGGIAAGITAGWASKRLAPSQLFTLGLLVLGALDIGMAVVASQPVTLGAQFLSGFPALFILASLNTLLQSHVPDAYRGRVFGAYSSVKAVASLLGSLAGGVLADRLGIPTMLGFGGVLFLVAGAVALFTLLPAIALVGQEST